MPLPVVSGWLIDIRTAESIFASGSNTRINHCAQQCKDGHMHICHCDEPEFKRNPVLEAAFLINQECVVVPDDDVMSTCQGVAAFKSNGKRRISGNEAAVFITAIAASKNYGVISDCGPSRFITIVDLCGHFGVPLLSVSQYFAEL